MILSESGYNQSGFTSMFFLGTSVLSSCGDLFVFYKKCLVQCAELSTGNQAVGISELEHNTTNIHVYCI